jgi:hypothetical protein
VNAGLTIDPPDVWDVAGDVPPAVSGLVMRLLWGTQYDVSPDGQHFYMMRRTSAEAPREIHVVYGWSASLR